MKRHIAVVTGSRAEYGLLRPILRLIQEDKALKLSLIVTGQHLSKGSETLREIRQDGFPIAARVPLGLNKHDEADIARAIGAGVLGFAGAFRRLRPDILLLLGDRYEILSAAAAALPFRIPVAHIHGGESTEGAIDEQIRHAVTKLSHLHFPVTEAYRRRILRMGEDPRRVFCFGAPGLDGIGRVALWDERRLFSDLGVPPGSRVGAVTYHPAALDYRSPRRSFRELAAALARVPGIFWVFTHPGADAGRLPIVSEIRAFVRRHPGRCAAFGSLGRTRYLSLLSHASVMVGNSSSGILESPSFGLPTVNVGDRQKGRLRAANVIDVLGGTAAIGRAIRRALSPSFRRSLARLRNPYEGKDSCRKIVAVLKRIPLDGSLTRKSFFKEAA